MKTFFVTFGQKYRHDEAHPTGGHPDGWFEVHAKDEETARQLVFADCGPKWGMIYDKQPSLQTYPLGCLRTLA